MSINNTVTASFEEAILSLQASFYATAATFALWGLHISLACFAIRLLCKRGLRQSRSRQCLCGIVVVMLVASTVFVILGLKFDIMQFASITGQDPSPDALHRAKGVYVASKWLSRLNYCLSDSIVVWRAWALWPNARVRWALGIAMIITAVCMVTSAIMVTLDNFEMPTTTSSTVSLYPDSALRALFYVPLMGTNILATSLICFKAWKHREDIRSFTTKTSSDGAEPSVYRSSIRVNRILALLIETGALYIILLTLKVLNAFGVLDGTVEGYTFRIIWTDVVMEMSAIYPTIIIILVSSFMSQEDALGSGLPYPTDSSPRLTEHVERLNQTGTLSTIRFNTSQLMSMPSSATPENGDHNLRGRGDERKMIMA